jgi:hypothetical protein
MKRIEGISRSRKWTLVPAILLFAVGAFILARHQPWNWLYLVVCLILILVASGAARKIAHKISLLFAFFKAVFNLMLLTLAGFALGARYLPSARSGQFASKKEWERFQTNLDPWTNLAFQTPPPRFAESVAELGCVLLPFVVLFLLAIAFPEIAK